MYSYDAPEGFRPGRTAGALLMSLTLLLCGCGSIFEATPNLTGNWQIEIGSGTGLTTNAPVALYGALSSQGPQVSGTLRLVESNLSHGLCSLVGESLPVSGTIDENRLLKLASLPMAGNVVNVTLTIPMVLTDNAVGSFEVDGPGCGIASAAAIAAQIAPMTGTFHGTAVPAMGSSGGTQTGTSTLTLVQSVSPDAQGQFLLSGTIALALGGCTVSYPVSGSASGVFLNVATVEAGGQGVPAGGKFANLDGSVMDASALSMTTFLTFAPGPCLGGTALLSQYNAAVSR